MSKSFEGFSAFSMEALESGLKAFAAVSKGAQAIAVETTDYARKTVEDGVSAWQSLASAKSFEKAVEIQSAYAKSTYQSFVAEASRLGSLYADLAKETYKPFEDARARVK